MPDESFWLVLAAALYLGAAILALVEAARRREGYGATLLLLATAVAANSVYIVLRWQRLDHGPYVDLHETLASSVWGYHFALLLAGLFFKRVRPMLAAVLPVLLILVAWGLFVPARDSLLPITYNTIWLPIHVLLGKVFIGCIIVAAGLGLVVLMRSLARAMGKGDDAVLRFAAMPGDKALDELAFRFVLVGFLFDTLMLIAGAIWAQDAWGRYWDWDPLETWSFLTWVTVAFYLHLRITKRPTPVVGAGLVIVIFVVAFMTFFRVPFLSQAAHQGVV
ncbi:MAG: cytochrome c biogenesis protein CcsA [Magnetovibrio sp.]|nr:cytochrome c biogenesis protein CcsA [Magnetovibrio sp.]